MKKFWCYISNDKYSVGCTGQTVYVYDKDGNELAKFKDIKYGYTAIFSPTDNIFVVKSTVGYLAVYSLSELKLIKRIKFSKIDSSQDDGFCFSADGKYFYNIERHVASYNSALATYDTVTFDRISLYLDDNDYVNPSFIECDTDGQLYVFGFERTVEEHFSGGYVSKLVDGKISDAQHISVQEYDCYRTILHLQICNFSERAIEFSLCLFYGIDVDNLDRTEHYISKLWKEKGSR